MTTISKISLAVVVGLLAVNLTTNCDAQVFIGGHGGGFHGTPVYNSGPYYGGVQHIPGPVSTVGYSYGWGGVPHYAQPRHPSIVTTPSFNGYNPWGGIDTRNTQVDNTYFAPGRDASRFNGSARYVNRPVFDNYGRVVGQERGTEWYNPSTGQVHGNKQVYTPNGSGGTNQSTVLHSEAGGNITPMNVGGSGSK